LIFIVGSHEVKPKTETAQRGVAMKRSLGFICLLSLIAILITTAPESSGSFAPTAFAQAFATKPLYRFQSARGQYLYTTNSNLPPGLSDGPWENEGIVCHVANGPNHVMQTTAVYQLAKSDDFGVHYFYTNRSAEADTAAADGWTKQGIGFHVSPTQVPGTVPLYRLYKPVVPEKQKDKSWLDKIGEFISGPEFTEAGAEVLQDAHFYTIRKDELSIARKSGFNLEGRIGYVWETPYPPPATLAPDLIVQHTQADETSVMVVLRNQGTGNTGGVEYEVTLSVYDDKNNFLYKLHQPAPGLSPNQSAQVKFETGGKSLMAKRYQVKVDEANAVEESNEDNNETEMLSGPALKLKPGGETTSVALSLSLTGELKHDAIGIGKKPIKRVDYLLKLGNPHPFPNEWYQSLTVLPPTNCEGKQTNARLILQILWKSDKENEYAKAGVWLRALCKPLMSFQDLSAPQFAMNDDYAVPDHLKIVVLDRLTGITHESNDVPVAVFGIADVLVPLGCSELVGRTDDFYCKNKTAMAACENLQKQGKPIKCRLTVPKAP